MRRPTTFALLLALALVAAHGPMLVGARTWSDRAYVTQVIPARVAAVDAIADGRMPGWWDRAGLGAPLWAEPSHGAAYPGWWPAAVAPAHAPWLLDVLAILHVLWAAVGVTLLARRLGADDLGALVAGSWFATCDVATGAIVGGTIAAIAHLPWAAWAGDVIARAEGRRPQRRGILALAAALAAMLLAGQWTIALDGAVLAAVMVLTRSPRRGGAMGAFGAAVALGIGLAAIAVVPALVHLGGEIAPAGRPGASGWTFVELLIPHAHTLGAGGSSGVFIGGAAFLFAVAAIATGGEGRGALGIAAAAFALAVGLVSADHAAAASVLVCALAGAGVTQLSVKRPAPRTLRAVVIACGALILLFAALAAARPIFARRLDVGDLQAAVVRVDRVLGHGAAATGFALGAMALVIAARRRPWPAAVPAAAVIVLVHAVIVGRLAHPSSPRGDLDGKPALLAAADTSASTAALEAGGLAPRIYRPEVMPGAIESAQDPAHAAEQTLEAATPTRWGYAAARYPAPGRQRDEDLLWKASATAGDRLFDRFSVELALVPRTVIAPGGFTMLGERGDWALVESGARRSRAFRATGWRFYADAEAAARAMFPVADGTPLPLGTLARIGEGEPRAGDEVAPCHVRAEAPERVIVHCDDGPAGMIALVDAWAPGWSVEVDGAAAPLERVDVAAIGVEVEAGVHDVVFSYQPPGLAVGRWISLACALGAVALALGGLIRSRQS